VAANALGQPGIGGSRSAGVIDGGLNDFALQKTFHGGCISVRPAANLANNRLEVQSKCLSPRASKLKDCV
jgi:hypothetical protein